MAVVTPLIDQFRSVFQLAGFQVVNMHAVINDYCPARSMEDPWYLVVTDVGMIQIGWRKRVIEISWVNTGLMVESLTDDDVTKGPTLIHAWNYGKAVIYLMELRRQLLQQKGSRDGHGQSDPVHSGGVSGIPAESRPYVS